MNKALSLCLCCSFLLFSCSPTVVKPPIDAAVPSVVTLPLPDGHFLTPAGTSVPVGSLPLGIAVSPDGKNAVVVNSGFGDHTLSVINIPAGRVVQTIPIRKSWMGAVWGPYGDYFFVTAGNDNKVYRYGFAQDSAWFLNSIMLGKPAPEEYVSPTGLDIGNDGGTIYAASKMSNTLFKLNAFDNTIEKTAIFAGPLYTCRLDTARAIVYVSEWGSGSVAIVDAASLNRLAGIRVGDHPSAMVTDASGKRLFVTNSGENTVSVIDVDQRKVLETIDVALRPGSPVGSTPNAAAVSGDTLLFVALAGNNAVAVVDIRTAGKSAVKGFIPTGWYPTAVQTAGGMLLVANGNGERSYPNPDGRSSSELIKGSLSFIPLPGDSLLTIYTRSVLENNPLTREQDRSDWTARNPLPRIPGTGSPITHVFFVVKELRSYDQILGDMPEGDGEDSLAVFGAAVTPNHHALAKEFVLLDNFHANGLTTADGMQYAVSGYSNDYVTKTWPTLYGRKGGLYDYEQEGMATSAGGYLWDAAMRAGKSVRNYGLFVDENASTRGEIIPMAKGLARITSPIYRGWDLYYYDTLRATQWMKEFDRYEAGDSLPNLSLIRLPNDNTAGESKKHRSRASYMADNDRALGMIVERISRSRYWDRSIIFVLETNAYAGADHRDAQRTVGLVIGPYVKRGVVDHTHYTTTSMVNAIERILGIPFMTQHDAGAMPMYRMFQETPNLKQFQSLPISRPDNEPAQ